LESANRLATTDEAFSCPPTMHPLLLGRRQSSDISTVCISKLGKLAVDAGHAGSPRDQAIDAVSTRPGEDQPNEDQRVQHFGEVQEVVEPGEDTARLDAVIRLVAIATIMSPRFEHRQLLAAGGSHHPSQSEVSVSGPAMLCCWVQIW
jgi:hypothetical protein